VISRVTSLPRRLLFRPHHALLLFGSLSLLSTWLWLGTGFFIGMPLGLAVLGVSLLASLNAGYALLRRRLQIASLMALVVATVAVPTLALIVLRWKTGAPILMHDGAYQTEEAIKLLLAGHDPYGFDYTTTSMRLWHWYVNVPIHPSLYHYLYAPPAFLLPLPAYLLAHWLGVAFDVRLVDLVVEAVAAIAILKLPWRWEWRYIVIVALFLDPFFYLAQGRNDILFLAPIALGVLAWERDRPLLATLAFGVAVAFKPFAVFFVPMLAVIVFLRFRSERWPTARLLAVMAGFVVPGLLTIGPFFAWHPGAYWADTVSFVTGTDPRRYPIQGYGLSEILLLLKVIPSPSAYFPFTILQIVTVLPTFALAVRRVLAHPTLARALWWGTAMLTVFLFFSRFVNDNYIASVIFLAVLAGAARRGVRDRRAVNEADRRSSIGTAAAA
jgi:hypothetical protein